MNIQNKQINGDEPNTKKKDNMQEYHFTPSKGRAIVIKATSMKEANKIYKDKYKK